MRTRISLLSLFLLLTATATPSECRNVVTYLYDGAMVEFEATAANGIIDIPLPAQLVDDTLRVKPLDGTGIKRVEILPFPGGAGRNHQEPLTLLEQKNRLKDRLKALEVREEIFKAAAKSQSGKAPRRSKSNPDPMQGIRQGTDFAIAQLEAVYTARRKTEQELLRIDSRIAQTRQETAERLTRARIRVSPARGKVLVRYAVADSSWTPVYDLFLSGNGQARLKLSGSFSGSYPGHRQQAAPTTLAGPAVAPFPAAAGPGQPLAEFDLAVSDARFGTGTRNTFSFLVENTNGRNLPAGDANLYRDGEYVGRFRFEGISSGGRKRIGNDR